MCAAPAGVGCSTDDGAADVRQQARRRTLATVLCCGAATPAAWEIADRLAVAWGFSCAALGVAKPSAPEGERRRKNTR